MQIVMYFHRTSQITLLYKVVGQIYSIVFKWNLFLSLHASPCTLYCMMHKEIEKLSYPGSQTILTSSLWSLVFLHTAIDQRLEVGMYWEQGWSWASYHETISQHVTRDCSINIVFRKIHLHSIGNARSFSRCMIIPLLGPMPSNCTIVYTHDGMLKSYKGSQSPIRKLIIYYNLYS